MQGAATTACSSLRGSLQQAHGLDLSSTTGTDTMQDKLSLLQVLEHHIGCAEHIGHVTSFSL